MAFFGVILIVLAAPLLLGYFIGGRKNAMWRNLAFVMMGIGALIVVLAFVTGS